MSSSPVQEKATHVWKTGSVCSNTAKGQLFSLYRLNWQGHSSQERDDRIEVQPVHMEHSSIPRE